MSSLLHYFAPWFRMITELKLFKQKFVLRLCSQGWFLSLHEKDMPNLPGILHASRALLEPDVCDFCHQLHRSALKSRVKFVQWLLWCSRISTSAQARFVQALDSLRLVNPNFWPPMKT